MNKYYCLIFAAFIFCVCESGAWANEALHIEVQGIQGETYKNVESRLKIEQEKSSSYSDTKAFLSNVPQIIRHALQPYGYFKPEITAGEIKHSDNGQIAFFRVNLGPPLKISSVKIELLGHGKNNLALQKLIRNFPIHKEMIFKSEDYEKAKESLFQTANDQGYIKSYFLKSEVRIDIPNYRADIILTLDTLNKYYFGNLTYKQNAFDPAFVNRFHFFKQDAHFSSKKLYSFQQDMSKSGYFQQVDATPDFDHIENYRVPVRVDLLAPKSQRYNIGIGYGTFTGPRLSASMNLRRVTNTGHHMNAEIKLSSVLKSIAAKYYIPGNNPLTDQYILGANYQKFSPKNGTSYSKNLSLGYIKNQGHWNYNLTLNYLSELYLLIDQPSKKSQLLYPSLNIGYVKADDILNPHYGTSLNLILQGGSTDVFSSVNFFQGELKGKYIFSPLENGRVILRGDLGYTLVNKIDKLPLTMRYFAGGIGSIRGYPDSSIGPGKYLTVASIEYQHRLWGDWYGAAFYDTGTASDHYGSPPFSIGDGVGIVYQSVVGPIKLYVSRAENKRGKPMSVEFNVGPEF